MGSGRIKRAVSGGPMSRGSTRGRRPLVAGTALALVLCLLGVSRALAAQTTALAVQVGSPARAVHGSDGREHIDHDLVITNAFTVPVRLESLRVFAGGRLLLALRGKRLADQTLTLADGASARTVPVSSAVKTLVDVVLPRSSGRRVPRRLTERLRYAIPPDAPGRTIIGSVVVRGPTVRVDRRQPIRIASPLSGPGWLDSNGFLRRPDLGAPQAVATG
jgi:hypothetical protein